MMNCNFESEEELCQAVKAWREMEEKTRLIRAGLLSIELEEGDEGMVELRDSIYEMLSGILASVDDLDKAAGMEALEGLGDDSL